MPNIIKRLIRKITKVTVEYTGVFDCESIPKNVTLIRFHPSKKGKVPDEAFKDCCKLKEVVFSEGVIKIGNGSFKGCTKLKRVVLNDGLKQIGHDAFSGCTSLESITFPRTVTKVGDRVFAGCSSLKHIIYMTSGVDFKRGWDLFLGCPLAMKQFRLNKIAEDSHLKELEKMIVLEIGSTIEMKDGYITVSLPQHTRSQIMDRLQNLIQYYEVKEATSLVELALWKAKISQADEDVYHPIDRDACRTEYLSNVQEA